ncbi:XRE family transcriptional regulator [Micromonospora sp. RTP1Z1]|uniref:helix-turn-helix domain-containing protein n=1 Tax=Micromonospora sp. RTP1Z1 TaxID=2994043 RepID=UPI0029C6ED9A|nr:XRE family transcriptional regulator [Micromonospora sp. RTP1Z1]
MTAPLAEQLNEGPNTEALMATVGLQLRTLRKLRGLTLEGLAHKADVSIGLISQIERGRGNPSFNTLVQLAHALDVPIGRLFHTAMVTSPVVRAHERRVLDMHSSGDVDALHALLTPNLDGALEAIWVEAPAGYDTTETPFSHPGEEFGLVLEGRHEVYLDGTRYVLEAGDSITYASTTPHWYRNPGPDPVKAIWIITPPTF